MTLLDRAIVRTLPAVPRPVVKRLSARYIAGERLADACEVVRELNSTGKMATLDVLGEEVTSRDEATGIRDEYRRGLEAIDEQGLDSNISVKLTGFGLNLDLDLCRENVTSLVRAAADHENFVRIDMEDSSTTSATLDLYRGVREEGLDNVGVVLQACMKRTLGDIAALAELRPNVRVCKGIYVEPPGVAYQEDETVRLAITDHGLGISPEDQERIFERFERLISVRHFGGFGLGLWIAQQITAAHGGVIGVRDPETGPGAEFFVELPLEEGGQLASPAGR